MKIGGTLKYKLGGNNDWAGIGMLNTLQWSFNEKQAILHVIPVALPQKTKTNFTPCKITSLTMLG